MAVFYIYSTTNKRLVLQREPKGKPAYDLAFISNDSDQPKRPRPEEDNCRYLVTSVFGKNADREKVESREFLHQIDAEIWAGYLKTQKPKKRYNVWKIQHNYFT